MGQAILEIKDVMHNPDGSELTIIIHGSDD